MSSVLEKVSDGAFLDGVLLVGAFFDGALPRTIRAYSAQHRWFEEVVRTARGYLG